MLGATGSLARIKNAVRVHLALEPGQERGSGRCRVGGGVGDAGVQVVGCHAGPQGPPGRRARRRHGTFYLPRRTAAAGAASARSAWRDFVSAH